MNSREGLARDHLKGIDNKGNNSIKEICSHFICNTLKRVINQSCVYRDITPKKYNFNSNVTPTKDITPEKVEGIVNAVKAKNNTISFTENEITSSSSHLKSLRIRLKCQGRIFSKVLIDGGAHSNLLPYSSFQQLSLDRSAIKPSKTIMVAYDGTRREVMGFIDLELEIGPTSFVTKFYVMDIKPVGYTMLLGRTWIHEAGAIPSTLHQRVKFIVDGKVITVKGEEFK